jgi:hypothetical protein
MTSEEGARRCLSLAKLDMLKLDMLRAGTTELDMLRVGTTEEDETEDDEALTDTPIGVEAPIFGAGAATGKAAPMGGRLRCVRGECVATGA